MVAPQLQAFCPLRPMGRAAHSADLVLRLSPVIVAPVLILVSMFILVIARAFKRVPCFLST